MSSNMSSLTILSEEQKFNRENLLSWTTNMIQLLGSKGLLGYTDGTITLPAWLEVGAAVPDPTPIYSTAPSFDEWNFRDKLARGHITLNCTDVAALGVKTTGPPKKPGIRFRLNGGKARTCIGLMLKKCLTKPSTLRAQTYRTMLSIFVHGELQLIILARALSPMKLGGG